MPAKLSKVFYLFLDISGILLGIFLTLLGAWIVAGRSVAPATGIVILLLGVAAVFIHAGHYRGTALLVVGDVGSRRFPDVLRPWAYQRSPGRLRFNLVINYNWQWDLAHALRTASREPYITNKPGSILGSSVIPRIDLVVRWGGRHRLSGFLPIQCAYADFYSVDALWPDMQLGSFYDALGWFARQEVTLGG